ncbi:MAG: PQQ-binding-like beta-propeller repeat protein [Chloroflexi bacterium]|nr:PQQ-binding-like beta-propeller repeat protein [Chloroflexota bacterium]
MDIPPGWPMWGATPQRTNTVSAQPAVTGLQLRWRFADTQGWAASSPVIANDVAYFGSSDTYVYAVQVNTHKLLWRFKTDGMVLSTPALADGKVFVGSTDHNLYAVDARSGDLVWKSTTDSWIVASPLPALGLVFVGSGDGSVYGFDSRNGRPLWRSQTGGWIVSSPAIDPGGTLVVGSWDGNIYGLDALSGQQKWKVNVGQPIVATPLVAQGMVLVPSLGESIGISFPSLVEKGVQLLGKVGLFDVGKVMAEVIRNVVTTRPAALPGGKLLGIDVTTGQTRWTAGFEGWSIGSLALWRDEVIMATTAGKKFTFKIATGSRQEVNTGNSGWIPSAPIVVGDVLYVVNGYGQGEAYDLVDQRSLTYPRGAATARVGFRVDGRSGGGAPTLTGTFASPAFAAGRLYVVSEDGQLLSYGDGLYQLTLDGLQQTVPVGGIATARVRALPYTPAFNENVTLTAVLPTGLGPPDVVVTFDRPALGANQETQAHISVSKTFAGASVSLAVRGVSDSGAEDITTYIMVAVTR